MIMGRTTTWVRSALEVLGRDATNKEIKAYVQEHAPEVPQGQIGLALRRLRESDLSAESSTRLSSDDELLRRR